MREEEKKRIEEPEAVEEVRNRPLGCAIVVVGSAILWIAFIGWIKLIIRILF